MRRFLVTFIPSKAAMAQNIGPACWMADGMRLYDAWVLANAKTRELLKQDDAFVTQGGDEFSTTVLDHATEVVLGEIRIIPTVVDQTPAVAA